MLCLEPLGLAHYRGEYCGLVGLVFVGPALPTAEDSARLPGATVLPLVAVGEILARDRKLAMNTTALR